MSGLPFRTTLDDVTAICAYLVKKPTGASIAEAKKVVDAKLVDFRKVAAYKARGLVNEADGRYKVTERGRNVTKGDTAQTSALLSALSDVEAYVAILERLAHRSDDSLTAAEVAAHWHEHFSNQVPGNEQILMTKPSASCIRCERAGASLALPGKERLRLSSNDTR